MADIELSSELFQDIQQAVQRQHPDADQTVVAQYLAAVMGYLTAGRLDLPSAKRDALMEELCGFARHVYDDVVRHQQQQVRRPTGQAFGYWVPPKK